MSRRKRQRKKPMYEQEPLIFGVCLKMAKGMGIDIGWMRIIWMILFIMSSGSVIFLYILLALTIKDN